MSTSNLFAYGDNRLENHQHVSVTNNRLQQAYQILSETLPFVCISNVEM
jgi:hypothetical protein